MDKTETKPVPLSDVREQLRALGITVAQLELATVASGNPY
jgi:hypothetical protein